MSAEQVIAGGRCASGRPRLGADAFGLFGQPLLARRSRRLVRREASRCAGRRRAGAAAQHESEFLANGNVGVAFVGGCEGLPPTVAATCQVAGSRWRVGVSAVFDQGDRFLPKVSRSRSSKSVSACSPRSTWPARLNNTSASALARAASGVRRAARPTTALTASRTRRPQRRCPAKKPLDDCRGHDHDHHRENVAGKRQLTAQAGQQHRRQRQARPRLAAKPAIWRRMVRPLAGARWRRPWRACS